VKFILTRSRFRSIARATGIAIVIALATVLVVPFPREKLVSFPASLVIEDREGRPLRVLLGPGGYDCRPVYRPEETDWIAKAIVAAEDQRFWSHPGLDPLAMARAMKQDLFAMRKVSGASTLSTQVIRMIEPRSRTLWNKAIEAFRALQMERRLSKEDVLAQYLNRAPFGSNISGIEAAARRYFGKGAHDLSLAEAAMLAGVPQSPSRLRPDRNPERAKKRQAYVLDRMVACGMISGQERDDAMAQKLALRNATYPFFAPHFCGVVAPMCRDAHDSLPLGEAKTTLDPKLQRVAEEALHRHAETLAKGDVRGGAIVILDVKTGAVRAMVGSPDFANVRAFGEVNAAMAMRSAGSTLKPFVYAMAFDRGLMTPQTVLADVPRVFRDYEPENFDKSFRGLVPAREALMLSLNMPAIDVEQRVGQTLFYDALKRLRFSSLAKPAGAYGLGLVIGNAEVRLLDLANAYACLARGGEFLPCRFFDVSDNARSTKVLSREACWLIADSLSGDERALDTTGHAADVWLPPMAWKTGTSAGFHDAWTIAYNPEFVIGVWVGNPDGASSEELVGRKVATPIVWEIFRRLYPDNDGPWFERPANLQRREVCAISGQPAGPYCRHKADDWFIPGVSSFQTCAVHPRDELETWPPEIASFLNRQRAAGNTAGNKASPLQITSPAPGATFRLLDGITTDAQKLSLSAANSSGTPLHWFINDRYLGESYGSAPLFWPVHRGTFRVVCADSCGHSDRVSVTVE
jgi:penicillin-binding protein 1C